MSSHPHKMMQEWQQLPPLQCDASVVPRDANQPKTYQKRTTQKKKPRWCCPRGRDCQLSSAAQVNCCAPAHVLQQGISVPGSPCSLGKQRVGSQLPGSACPVALVPCQRSRARTRLLCFHSHPGQGRRSCRKSLQRKGAGCCRRQPAPAARVSLLRAGMGSAAVQTAPLGALTMRR